MCSLLLFHSFPFLLFQLFKHSNNFSWCARELDTFKQKKMLWSIQSHSFFFAITIRLIFSTNRLNNFYMALDGFRTIFRNISRTHSLRSSHQRDFLYQNNDLKNFANFTGLKACKFVKKRFQRRRFPVKFAKFLKTPILKNICELLLL